MLSIFQDQPVFSVSELNRLSRELLETQFSQIWVEGEISNFIHPGSGHWYFTLKDSSAQIRCAMFRPYHAAMKFRPQDGMHVMVQAKVSVYETRGDYQLIVSRLEEIGQGALQRAFEQLKEKLFKEGLFDETHKKPIPVFPHSIGIITSPTGAAIRDILTVLKRRYKNASVIVYPTLVQGEEAAKQISTSIQYANRQKLCDVIILARGGGSLEDLWPFNEACVARTIFTSQIPIITGIGHEIDFTIADFVADLRAPTPSAAAELATPDSQELLKKLEQYYQRFFINIRQALSDKKKLAEWLLKQFWRAHPLHRLQNLRLDLDRLNESLITAQSHLLSEKKRQLVSLSHALNAVSPLATLRRGYTILSNAKGKTISASGDVVIGEKVSAYLASGKLHCTIDEID